MKKKRNGVFQLVLRVLIVPLVMVTILLTVIRNWNGHEDKIMPDNKISNPENYTWEEYQSLDLEEQVFFPDYFESMEEFNSWYEKTNPEYKDSVEDISIPEINLKGKLPTEWTKEDYEELTPDEQMYFPDYFDTFETYEEWYSKIYKEE